MATAPPKHGTSSCGHDGEHVHDHAHNHEDDLDDLDLAFDPTLASCCERDEHEYKKAMQLKAVLTAHDPSSGAVRMRQQLFQPPAPVGHGSAMPPQSSVVAPQVPPPHISDSESDSDDFDDSDDEFGMEAMLAVRRKQFEQQLHKATQDAADGYGLVLDAPLPQLVQEMQSEREVPRVVLVMDSSCAAESPTFLHAMREEMTAVAQRFLGTKFYVTMAMREDDALRQLQLPSVPSLAAFRRGERVDSIALDAKKLVTELEVLWEARLLPWLTKCGVLTSERQVPRACQSKSNRTKVTAADEETGFDCGVDGCRLRFGYEHEHVGTSQQTKDEIAAWRQSAA